MIYHYLINTWFRAVSEYLDPDIECERQLASGVLHSRRQPPQWFGRRSVLPSIPDGERGRHGEHLDQLSLECVYVRPRAPRPRLTLTRQKHLSRLPRVGGFERSRSSRCIRQLWLPRSAAGAPVGAEQHQAVRRRSIARDRVRPVIWRHLDSRSHDLAALQRSLPSSVVHVRPISRSLTVSPSLTYSILCIQVRKPIDCIVTLQHGGESLQELCNEHAMCFVARFTVARLSLLAQLDRSRQCHQHIHLEPKYAT